MNTLVPGYLYPYVLAGNVATVATVLVGLDRSLRKVKWAAQDRRLALWKIGGLLLAWWIVAMTLSWRGVFQGSSLRAPTIQYGLLAPILAGVLLYVRWPLLRRAVDAVPQQWLVGVQLYRALGLIFLVLNFQAYLPWQFAWPAGAGDVFVGLMAPVVAVAYARKKDAAAAGRVRAWNWLGIADLVVAVSTGVLTSPSPIQLLAMDSPNRLIRAFPLVTIPVFLVPLWILFHLASLRKLRQAGIIPAGSAQQMCIQRLQSLHVSQGSSPQ